MIITTVKMFVLIKSMNPSKKGWIKKLYEKYKKKLTCCYFYIKTRSYKKCPKKHTKN